MIIVLVNKIKMSKKSRTLIAAETNLIRKMLEQNVNCSHQEIMEKLQISRPTYHRYIKRIMDQDAKIWDEVHMDSAKYRAQRLVDSLLNCVNLCKKIMNDENAKVSDRIEASKTLCIAETNIYKIVEDGPTFRVSLPLYPNQESINNNNNNDNSTKELPN